MGGYLMKFNSNKMKIFSIVTVLILIIVVGLFWYYNLLVVNKKSTESKNPVNIMDILNKKDTGKTETVVKDGLSTKEIDATKVKYADVPKSRPTMEEMERREKLEASQNYKEGQYGVVVDTSSIRYKSDWNTNVRGQTITVVADATVDGDLKSVVMVIVISGNSEGMVIGGYDTDNSPQIINIMRVNGPLSSIAKVTIDFMTDNGSLDQFARTKVDNFAYYKLSK